MKVVLFCGGQGTRINGPGGDVPKPMLPIGYRPILWHIMKYYASFGHRDFILCLGYRADAVKDYFLHYNEAMSNDFVLTKSGKKVQLVTSDIDDWTITFVDTGQQASIGERLRKVEPYLHGEEYFLANYSDGLTDLDLSRYIDEVKSRDMVMSFLSVRPELSFHVVSADDDGCVRTMTRMSEADIWINGGYFVCGQEIFQYLHSGEDLVDSAFPRLIADGQLLSYPYRGFWMGMDTFRDRQRLEDLWARGQAPWEVWKCS